MTLSRPARSAKRTDLHEARVTATGETLEADAGPRLRLIDAMPSLVLVANARGEVTHHNRAWFAYTGLTPERSRGDGWLSMLHDDDRERRSACWASALAADASFTMELRLRRATKRTYRRFIAHVSPVPDETGTTEYWLESYVDVEDFGVSRELCGALDHLGHMVTVRDADETVAFVSPSWVRFSGGIAAPNSRRERRDFVHPDDVRLVEELVADSHAAPLRIQQKQVRVRSRDGGYRWFLSRSIVLPATPETPERRLNTLTDIDDLKREQAALSASASELSYEANHDPLTDLLNRRGFIDRLSRLLDEAADARRRVVVCYLDVDHFKPINDTLGHDAGDAFLRAFSARVRDALRSVDIVSRFGGDEFVIACPIGVVADVEPIVGRIREAVRMPFEVAGRVTAVSCSVGAAVFPDRGSHATELIERADAAIYEVKRCGRGGWRLYETRTRP